MRPLLLVALAVALVAAPAAAPAGEEPFGDGADQVLVLPPRGTLRSVVVFVHGRGALTPEGSAWIEHLRSHGSAVVYGKPVVAVGYSWGGKLVFDCGVRARAWSVPVPRAVASVFPASLRFGGPPEGRLPQSVVVLLQAGDVDAPSTARAYWRGSRATRARASSSASSARRAFPATHDAPTRTTPAARRTIWAPLDALVADARSSG